MPVCLLHDSRVDGVIRPVGFDRIVVQLKPSRPAAEGIAELLGLIQANPHMPAGMQGYGMELVILCHGSPNGLVLGAGRPLNQHDVGLFAPLRGRFGQVSIRACAAAMIYNRGPNPAGSHDGAAFCAGLARTLGARVMAADAIQGFGSSNAAWNATDQIVLADWAGNVGTWGPQGQLLGVSTPAQRAAADAAGTR